MSRRVSLSLVLALTVLGVGMVFLLQEAMSPRIQAEQQAIQARSLLDLLPPESYDNQPLEHPLPIRDVSLEHSTLLGAYLATHQGQPSAVLLRSQVTGYAGPIELLIVVSPQGRLLGSKALRQAETPGLGGHIAEHPNAWLQGFIGKSHGQPDATGWAVKKDSGQFDQMAGATITSRAVIDAIHDSLRYFDEHAESLLGHPAHE